MGMCRFHPHRTAQLPTFCVQRKSVKDSQFGSYRLTFGQCVVCIAHGRHLPNENAGKPASDQCDLVVVQSSCQNTIAQKEVRCTNIDCVSMAICTFFFFSFNPQGWTIDTSFVYPVLEIHICSKCDLESVGTCDTKAKLSNSVPGSKRATEFLK